MMIARKMEKMELGIGKFFDQKILTTFLVPSEETFYSYTTRVSG